MRIAALLPAALYIWVIGALSYGLIEDTLFRPPNQVFPMTDGPGWIGYFLFLGAIAASGITAGVVAFFLKGLFRILYIAKGIAVVYALLFLPMSFAYNADPSFHPEIPDQNFICGTWRDDNCRLGLYPNNTYRFSGETYALLR